MCILLDSGAFGGSSMKRMKGSIKKVKRVSLLKRVKVEMGGTGVMSDLLFVNNTSDIRVLRERIRILNETVQIANEDIKITEEQRNKEMMDANIFATMIRTLASNLNLSKDELQKIRAESRKLCEEDYRKRGFKLVYEKPPKFSLKLK